MGIPVCVPVIPKNAKRYVDAVIERNWVSSLCFDEEVNFIKKLEEGFSSYIGVRYGIAVTNGTTALQLALSALKIGPGDEVIVPSFTMIATASSVVHVGARPVFADADPETWCIDAGQVERFITAKTKAIIPVHIYGYPVDMDTIMSIATKHKLRVIEDAAEAIGTEYHGRKAGSFGEISCFSFYANKLVTSGEGGIVVTNDEQLARRAAMLKDQAFGKSRFIHEDVGFNFRMNNLTAAYAYASFEEVETSLRGRVGNANLYNELLDDIEGITLPPKSENGTLNSYWMYGILIDPKRFGRTKSEVRQLLKSEHSIDTRDFFYPMHRQPIMIERGYVDASVQMPVSEKLWDQGLYLPSSTNLAKEEIHSVVRALKTLKR